MNCWIVTEGIAGTENQCIGVAEALGIQPIIKRIGLRQPWKTFSPYLKHETSLTFTGDSLSAPWPDLLIAAGRKAIPAARYIIRRSGGRTRTVFLQNPRIDTDIFDLVAAPAHDRLRGKNVIATSAAPNRLTQDRLDQARADWESTFAPLPAPRVAVLIGGNSRTHRLTPEITKRLAAQLKDLADQGFSLMITTSRRTGKDNEAALRAELKGTKAWIWDSKGRNPYFGMLTWAGFILVTSDSVSMVSDAASTGRPVYVVPLEGGSPRFDLFHKSLLERGIIRHFEGSLLPYAYTPLDDAGMVAAEIRNRYPQLFDKL